MTEAWSSRTQEAVRRANPYGQGTNVGAWAKAVEREAVRSGEPAALAADRLSRYVRAHRERYGNTLEPGKLGRGDN